MNKLLMALVLVLLGGSAFAQDSFKVYVYSAGTEQTSGFTDRESEKGKGQRNDSVTDLKKALEGKKNIQVVDDPAEARIKIAVDWRSEGWKGNLKFDFNSLAHNEGHPIMVSAHLMVDDYTLPMIGRPRPRHPGWRGAANDVASQVEDWVQLNEQKLARTN